MKRYLKSAVYAAALLLGSVSADAILSAATAQEDVSVSFQSFHDQLAPYGDWVYSDRWGEVWIPDNVSEDFHPYGTRGHWVNTDEYGWLWVSDYEWGDIPFHYGRWVNDPDDGWIWIPGYVWSPGWVVWRNNGQYTGWMPMPPDDEFLGRGPSTSIGISIGGLSISFNNTNDDYGYSRWYGRDYGEDRFASNWVFIGTNHIGERDYGRYWAPRNNYRTLISNTRNVTNYTVVNNYIVNRSVDPRAVQKAGGRVETVRASQVIRHPQFVARADTGSQIQARMRQERPRGTGLADSAPKPTAAQIQSLSTKAPRARGGKAPAHLYTRDTVTKAPLAQSPAAPAPNAMTPAEVRDKRRGITPTTEAPTGKPEAAPAPATSPAAPGETPRERRLRTETPPATPSTTQPATAPASGETPRERRMRERTETPPATPSATQPATAPASGETPRERGHMERPATESSPMTPSAETPRARHHAPATEGPAMTQQPAERPAVERPRPAETHAPAEPREKKEPPKKPKHEEQGEPEH